MLNYTNDHNFGTKHAVNVIQVSICSLEQDLSNDIQDGCYFMIYYKNWLFFMQISRFVYLKTKLKLVLCQKIRSIIHRIGVQSFILLSQSAQYFCLTAILVWLS